MDRRHQEGEHALVRDVTSGLACLGIWGPAAREILESVCDDDLSNDGFRHLTARDIEVADVPCFAARVTYVGELGWELYPSTEFAVRLWDRLIEAGAPHGLLPAGYRAIDSLSGSKGYRSWGADITPDDSPLGRASASRWRSTRTPTSWGATRCIGSAPEASPAASDA